MVAMPEICPNERVSFRWFLDVGKPCFILNRVEFERDTVYVHYNSSSSYLDMTAVADMEKELVSYLRSHGQLRLKMLDQKGGVLEEWEIDHEFSEARHLPARALDYSVSEFVHPCVALKIRDIRRVA